MGEGGERERGWSLRGERASKASREERVWNEWKKKERLYLTHCVPVTALMFLHIFIMCSSDWITFGPAMQNGVAAFNSLKNSDSCNRCGLVRHII